VREGVLVFASGSLTHNLGEMVPGAPENAAQPHVAEFSDWFAARLAANEIDALLDWETGAPHAARAHPTPEHLLPLFVALGAAGPTPDARAVHRGYQLGALAMDAWRFDPAAG
jgi:4,5-DOPA dioxygenase extradiol